MTLIVSLRIPDGVVIAGDSLATMTNQIELQGEMEITCPQCSHQHTIKPKLPFSAPATTFAFAQKVFPFQGKFGIGIYGTGQLVGKSIYFAVRQFEQDLPPSDQYASASEAAKHIGDHLHQLLVQQVQKEGKDINSLPDTWEPLGFQVAGYDGDEATTIEVKLGKNTKIVRHATPGCTCSGQADVVNAIWSLYKNQQQRALIHLFSLQDAIQYATFLIETTARHQRFSSTMPGVGGDIDVALITPFDKFRWIQQKALAKVLGG